MLRTVVVLIAVAGWAVGAGAADPEEPAPKAEAPARPDEPPPATRIVLGPRTSAADGTTVGLGHTSGPVIDVSEPRADTVAFTMTGQAVAAGLPCEESKAAMTFELVQTLRIRDVRPGELLRLKFEAELVGFLRGNRDGAGVASVGPAEVVVTAGGVPVVQAAFECHTHTGRDLHLVNDRVAPPEVVVPPGEYCLTQRFALSAAHPRRAFHKNLVQAAFGPDSGRIPDWVVLLDTTRGEVPRPRDPGFRVVIRVSPAPAPPPAPARR